MADTGRLSRAGAGPAAARRRLLDSVTALRIAIIVTVLAAWEALAASGLLYRDVVPSLTAIGSALWSLLTVPDFSWRIELAYGPLAFMRDVRIPQLYWNLYATLYEVGLALVIGILSGLAVGIVLGGSKLMRKAFEPFIYYLGPTPKIIFLPVMIMWFGIGPASKVAMGAVSCFFPVALNVAGGMRAIDSVLIRVGRSFRANPWQMVTKIYLPAMRRPLINGARLGLGVALIGTLLAETQLSNRGLGFMVNQAYNVFNMPRLYALLIVVFVIAIGLNALIGRLGGLDAGRGP